MRKIATLAACLAPLTACVSVDPITPSSEGYDAIEFTRATVVQDHAFNQYVFAAVAGSLQIDGAKTDVRSIAAC
ncbi:hypothetical protein [Shinella zoogloeoides]|uniref:hypothetical protein n=1 Tax=Shinella zoogloeoides TaxID=352475 RepID=UPI00273FDA42|nr:hypothetical protein [Shinella zoogloeoides]WLR93876.1 hypothetical protein Q9316_06730 [Shinella zoogloeoides]